MRSSEFFKISITILLLLNIISLIGAFMDPDLVEELSSKESTKVLVYFSGGNSEVIRHIRSQSFPTRLSKQNALVSDLRALTNSMHSPLRNFLQSQNVRSDSYWSSNQMIIHDANLQLLQRVDLFPQVKRIRKLPEATIDPLVSSVPASPREESTPWGILKIQADRVWSRYGVMGTGVVVATIDTGVRKSHEALKNWRSEKGWLDPYRNTTEPEDADGHGTHVTGIIAGSGGIGVAPSSTWIACRGCIDGKCDAGELLACGDWILAPSNPDKTDPDPAMAPDIVSNSWGNPGGNDDWYNATIEAWEEAGILHAFAIGNAGPFCRSGTSPADQRGVFAVGSTDEHDKLSVFSSKGPVDFFEREYIKPDITAPGSDIYSAWATEDNAYRVCSGTSMATPFVAGTMALVLSAKRNISSDDSARIEMKEMYQLLTKTTDTKDLSISFPNSRCSNGRDVKWPNNEFGYGRLNALRAVSKVVKSIQN